MKRACYILTMILFFVSALLMCIPADISPFYGIFWITIFGGMFASIGLTAFIAVLLIVFITSSHFKNGKYKYIVLAVFIVLLICNIIYAMEGFAATFASIIFTVVLMVLSFLCAKRREPTDEYQPIILKIALITLAVIVSIFLVLIFMIVFGTIEGAIESEIGMKKYIKSETQTPVSEEIANNFNSKNYEEITSGWVMLDSKTAMLPYGFTTNYKACWIIENDPRFIIRVVYDTWDEIARETPLVSKEFEYPNVLTDMVTGVALIDWYDNNIFDDKECNKFELTSEQAETLRSLVFSAYSKNTDEEKIQLNNDDWVLTDYGDIKSKSVFWSYNNINAIYYSYGEIIKNKDGNYYICADFSRYFSDEYFCTFYEKIPDDIALQIDSVFEE